MKKFTLALAGLALASSAIQAAEYTVNSLVQTSTIWSEPSINDMGDFTWGQHDGNDWEIHLYEASSQTTRQLTNNDITWDFMNAPNAQGISVYSRQVPDANGSQPLQIGLMDVNTGVETVLYTGVYKFATNSRGDVTWVSNDDYGGVNGNQYDVYLYTAATGTTTLLYSNSYPNAFVHWWTYLNHTVISDNGSVVWVSIDDSVTPAYYEANTEVYYYNAATGVVSQLTHNADKESNAIMAPNGDAMWNTFDGNDYEIMHYNAATGEIAALTNSDIDNQNYTFSSSNNAYFEDTNGYYYDAATKTTSLIIDAAQMGWGTQINGQGDLAWASGLNIFKYTAATGTITQLSNDDSGYSYPVMNEQGDVTWISNSGTAAATNEVFVYNAADGVISQLSNATDIDYWPQINALGEVIWAAWNDTDAVYHIYKAVPNPVASQCEIQELPASDYPVALNNNGDVLLQNGKRGILWSNGESTVVKKRRRTLYMRDINDNRQVIANSPRDGILISYIWDNGSVRNIGDDDVYTSASSINNQGQVTGFYRARRSYNAMLWEDGVLTDLGPGNGADINSSGQIAGYFNDTRGMWDNYTIVPFGTTPSIPTIYTPTIINDKGQMLAWGIAADSNEQARIAVSDNGVVTGTYALNDLTTYPVAINNNGIILGDAYDSDSGKHHVVVIKGGVVRDLTDLLPPNSGWSTLENPADLNDSGQVIGSGTKADGTWGHFLASGCL